jgi:cell division protein FtsZ
VRGAEILFVALGLGGGTGSGAAPVIAELGREAGALTIAVATIPFSFEGHRRSQIATEGLENLQAKSDTTIAISNDRLLEFIDADTSLDVSFRIADEVLRQGVQGVAELVTSAGVINLNLMHVRTILSDAGSALMSIGQGRGEGRAMEAAELAISSPLTQSSSIEGASAILVNITGGNDLSLDEIKRAVSTVAGAAGPDADVFFGATVDPNMAGQLQVMLIAVGMNKPMRALRPESVVSAGRLYNGHSRHLGSAKGSPEGGGSPIASEIDLHDLDIPAFLRRRRLAMMREERND